MFSKMVHGTHTQTTVNMKMISNEQLKAHRTLDERLTLADKYAVVKKNTLLVSLINNYIDVTYSL